MNTYSTQSNVTVPLSATSIQLVPPGPNRIAILISSPITNRFTMSLLPTAVLDQGITLYSSGSVLVLTEADHGDLVTRAWSATSAVGSQVVSVIQVFRSA